MSPRPRSASWVSRCLRRATQDDGYAATAILYPALLLLTFTIIQAGLYFHAGTVAQSAAITGYNQARAFQSTDQAGQQAALEVLSISDGFLTEPNTTVTRTPTTVSVSVTGSPIVLIPGLPTFPVTKTVTGPIERWVAP